MSVRSAQLITNDFTTRNPATGAAADADSLPTGTLVVNGTDNAASVTVTNKATGIYKFAVTLPTLAIGDEVQVRIAATVAAVADNAVVWGDVCDLSLDSSGRVDLVNAPNATARAAFATTLWQDATAGDFTAANSVGKSVFTGVAPGATNGYMINGTNAGGVVFNEGWTITGVGQPALKLQYTGVLARAALSIVGGGTGDGVDVFPGSGGAAIRSDIVGTLDTVTTLTNMPVVPTVAQIATGVWQDATAGDFTASGSIGKGLYTSGIAPGSTGGLPSLDANGNVQANLTKWKGATPFDLDGFGNLQANVNRFTNGVLTPAALPATGFAYAHGVALTSDQGGPALSLTASSFSAVSITNTGTGDAVNVGNSGAGNAVRVTGPFVGAAIVQAVWDALLTALTAAGSIGAKLASAIFTGGFTGPSSVTLTFHDNLGAAVPNVEFTVLGQGSMRANSSGIAAFGLPDGTYSVVANVTNLVIFPTAALVVSGTTALTIAGATANIPAPPTPAQTTAYGVTRDAHGNPKGVVAVTFELENPDQAADVYDGGEFTATSDSAGNLLVVLLKAAKYGVRTPSGKFVEFTTTTADTQPLPNVLGPY